MTHATTHNRWKRLSAVFIIIALLLAATSAIAFENSISMPEVEDLPNLKKEKQQPDVDPQDSADEVATPPADPAQPPADEDTASETDAG